MTPPDQRCEYCNGSGTVEESGVWPRLDVPRTTCLSCNGTGTAPAVVRPETRCGGCLNNDEQCIYCAIAQSDRDNAAPAAPAVGGGEVGLPGWPGPPQPIWIGTRGGTELQAIENARYERARADAAMARLRVATEFLDHLREVVENEDDRQDCTDVLAAIGPLPPLPSLPEEGE